MSWRSRHTSSFKPHSDHLEERAGASVLIPGELPSAVADLLQPSEDGSSHRSVSQPGLSGTAGKANGSGSYSLLAEDRDPGIKAVAGLGASAASVSEPGSTDSAPADALRTMATGGMIRPLTLAPSAQPVSPGLGSILFPAGGLNPLNGERRAITAGRRSREPGQ